MSKAVNLGTLADDISVSNGSINLNNINFIKLNSSNTEILTDDGTISYDPTTKNLKISDGTNFRVISGGLPSGGITNSYTENGRNYISHTFLTSDTFTVISNITVDVFLVAGGGGAGPRGGGGGAGGVAIKNGITLTPANYPIIIGNGGGASSDSPTGGSAYNGTDSKAFGFLAKGGGAGGLFQSGSGGNIGGSGGGKGRDAGGTQSENAIQPSVLEIQGYRGGGSGGTSCAGSGGGGGAGGRGPDSGEAGGASGGSGNERGGNGGIAITNTFRNGTAIWYAGGGGGGCGCPAGDATSYGLGGGTSVTEQKGGGGDGSVAGSRQPIAGLDNTGGGGGGGADYSGWGYNGGTFTGAPGGSGIVVIRYQV